MMFIKRLSVEGNSNTTNIQNAAKQDGKILANIFSTGILTIHPMMQRLTAIPSNRTNERAT